ncbi:9499ac82-533b-4d7d-9701-288bb9778143-CDS [Sclerotinia trifoliorum]|uniref:9499ac82-533b-4d7d-9701-288bb9778143-CDS n=1 Tax=Sclerotinia trifoliorum TaxID=28548 RepID=A0A8H2W0M6_9HELO|nr:9499ac82-533b-4d7d-9701-288bb9778143-CDS [Sclerotinia trifoliorum]
MSQNPQPWFTDSEIRFLDTLCAPHAPPMPATTWQTIIDRFFTEQVRHLPGGDFYHLDPWPKRVRISHAIFTDPRLPVGESLEADQAIVTLLGVVHDPEPDPEQGQVHVQMPLIISPQPQEDETLPLPEGSIRLPAGNIRLPEGSILLPDRSILFPDGRLLLTNSPRQAAPFVFLPDGRIRLPNGRMFRASSDIGRPVVPRPNVRYRNGRAYFPDGSMVPGTPSTPMTPSAPMTPRIVTPSRTPAALIISRTPRRTPAMPYRSLEVPGSRFNLPSPEISAATALAHDDSVLYSDGSSGYLSNDFSSYCNVYSSYSPFSSSGSSSASRYGNSS